MRPVLTAWLAGWALLAAGCGQKGPLTLPKAAASAPMATSPAPAAAASAPTR